MEWNGHKNNLMFITMEMEFISYRKSINRAFKIAFESNIDIDIDGMGMEIFFSELLASKEAKFNDALKATIKKWLNDKITLDDVDELISLTNEIYLDMMKILKLYDPLNDKWSAYHIAVMSAMEGSMPDADKEKYYASVMGEGYRGRKFFDTISQEEVNIGEFLAGDPDNLIFKVSEGLLFSSHRSLIRQLMPLYECTIVNSMSSFTDNVYISLSNLGCPCIGVADYNALKLQVLDKNYQVFQLQDTKRKTGALVSHDVRFLGTSFVSDAHCQAGSESNYYALYIT